jgi:hypothetical protein
MNDLQERIKFVNRGLTVTRIHAKCSPDGSVFISRFQIIASNSGDSTASTLTPFLAGHRLTTELSC